MCDLALTYGVRGHEEDADSLEVAFDSTLSHKMPHVEMVKAAHTDEDDKPEELAGKLQSLISLSRGVVLPCVWCATFRRLCS